MKYINYDARSKKTPKQQALSHTQSKFGCPLDTVNRLRQQVSRLLCEISSFVALNGLNRFRRLPVHDIRQSSWWLGDS